jgi:pyruvate kinase
MMKALKDFFEQERGRKSALAKALKIAPAAISQWKTVPADRIFDVSRFTGLPIEKLRPDLVDAAESIRPEAAE